MTTSRHTRRVLWAACAAVVALSAGAGCRQRMSDQPYYRPLEQCDFFPDGRSARPLERGTVHRGQYLETDPIATGLTAEEWGRSYEYAIPAKPDQTKPDQPLPNDEKVKRAIGAPRYDQRQSGQPKVYVEEFPFAITQTDLKRGQERYTIFCAVCHGPLGNGQGKVWERGYLTPTSFHTQKVTPTEVDPKNKDEGLGISRGYKLWTRPELPPMPMDQVPVGYIFEVVTRGFGGMPSYSAQIPPEDRWRIAAYVRVLQMSQRAPANLTPEAKKMLDGVGGKQ